jgi:hypothetical protein
MKVGRRQLILIKDAREMKNESQRMNTMEEEEEHPYLPNTLCASC